MRWSVSRWDTLPAGEAVYAAAGELISAIESNTALRYNLVELRGISAEGLASKAGQSDTEGMAYRYALVNLDPFVLQRSDTGGAAPDAHREAYDPDSFDSVTFFADLRPTV